jgi:hypothetical protein
MASLMSVQWTIKFGYIHHEKYVTGTCSTVVVRPRSSHFSRHFNLATLVQDY